MVHERLPPPPSVHLHWTTQQTLRNEKMIVGNVLHESHGLIIDGSPKRSSLRTSSNSLSPSMRRSVRRSVSFSDDEIEVHMVEKIALKKKDKENLWFTSSEYDTIRTEAKVLAGLLVSFGKISEGENTYRGLEQMKVCEQARVIAARESVLDNNEEIYSFLASTAVRKAQELALKDAKDAAEYQKETSTEKSQRVKSPKKGILKFLPHRSMYGRS